MVALLAEERTDGPWVGLTISGLGVGTDVLTVWRTAGGERLPVQGARDLEAVDSAYVIDYEVPFGVPATYVLEVLEGPDTGLTASATLTVESECGYLHDPLEPSVVVPVWATRAPNGEPVLAGTAFRELVRGADVEVHRILGSRYPVAIGGQRQAAAGVDLSLLSDAEVQNTRLRDMMARASVLVLRPLPGWMDGSLPPVGYVSVPEVVEQRLTAHRLELPETGRHLTRWQMVGQYVRPSAASILVALFTYQDVEALFETYAQKQASAGGGTYLDDLKNPLGA